MPLWWMGFVDEYNHHEAAIVEAEDFDDALERTHQLGINPGYKTLTAHVIANPGPIHLALRERLITPSLVGQMLLVAASGAGTGVAAAG